MAIRISPPSWALERLKQSIDYWQSLGAVIDHWEWRYDWSFVLYIY
jgi:hypothetical protein